MCESALIRAICARAAAHPHAPGVLVGPGDDACVVEAGGATLVVTVDQLVEGWHYERGLADPDAIARKAVARSLSDISAMGASPWFGIAAGTLPGGIDWSDELCARLQHWGESYGAPIIGGDISSTDGPLTLSITQVGRCDTKRGPVLRSGARAGDLVCITGRIGGAVHSGRHMTPPVRTKDALWLAEQFGGRLHAMIDVSDGLGVDAGHIADASGVRIELEGDAVPLNDDAGTLEEAIREGEDYELLFTVAAGTDLPERCPETGTPVTVIGRCVEGEGCVLRTGAGETRIEREGWEHGG